MEADTDDFPLERIERLREKSRSWRIIHFPSDLCVFYKEVSVPWEKKKSPVCPSWEVSVHWQAGKNPVYPSFE